MRIGSGIVWPPFALEAFLPLSDLSFHCQSDVALGGGVIDNILCQIWYR
jgi:hypothetical protein